MCIRDSTYRERDDKRRRALEEEVKELLQELRAMGVSEEDIQALCLSLIHIWRGFPRLIGYLQMICRGKRAPSADALRILPVEKIGRASCRERV